MASRTALGTRMEETGERVTGAHDETKWAPLWTLEAIIGAAYILSRGLAKVRTDHAPFARRSRRPT
jgi:hypothetical protein